MTNVTYQPTEEEILDIAPDQIEVKTYDELIVIGDISGQNIIASNIKGGTLNVGSGDKVLKYDSRYGFWLGDANFDDAPFSVDLEGNVIATSATITGVITATTGKIGGTANYWDITAGAITAVSASADVMINYGKTDFTNTDTGFILGYDFSASLAKFYIGNNSVYMNWTGSALTINSAGINVINEGLKFYNTTTLRGKATTAATSIAFQLYNDAAAVINSLFIGSTSIYTTFESDLGGSSQYFDHGYLRQGTITQSASQSTGPALLVQRNVVPASTDDPVLKVIQDHVDDTENATLILQDGLATALQVQTANNSNVASAVYFLTSGNNDGLSVEQDYASCTKPTLKLNHGGDGTHINFLGDPSNSSSADGDLWFDGTNLKINVGGTVYNINKTAV